MNALEIQKLFFHEGVTFFCKYRILEIMKGKTQKGLICTFFFLPKLLFLVLEQLWEDLKDIK